MKLGLIGGKLGHSYSKIIHEELRNEPYELWPLNEDDFHKFMDKKDFDGINVTIPYKQKVIPYLDTISESAKKIGAVNTIVNDNGKLYGYNTDYDGFLYLIKKHNIEVKGKTVCILGTGGTSKTAKCVLEDLQAKIVYKATIEDLDEENLLTYEELALHNEIEIFVNTTPVGMYPNLGKLIIDLDCYKNVEAIIDVVYNPIRTQLILEAEKRKIKAVSGLEMLVTQAKVASEIFFHNSPINNDEITRIYQKLKTEVLNIVLIGMPGSGKSTIASQLQKVLHSNGIDMDVLECDKIIEEKAKMTIPEIFKKYGEQYFRDLEENVIKEVSLEKQKIISSGGGVILRQNNINNLKGNGIIIWIDRSIDKIIVDEESRPLTKNKEDLEKRYQERKDLYKQYADIVIKNDDNIIDAVKGILGELKWL